MSGGRLRGIGRARLVRGLRPLGVRAALVALGGLTGVLLFQLGVMPLFVRHGAESEVPDLRGLPAAEVAPLLAQEGLHRGGVQRAHDDHIPIGRILRHAPPAGKRVKRGRRVDLVVSLGPEALRVPLLEGESLVHARFLLLQAGLAPGKVRRVASRSVPERQVVACSPPPGTPLRGRTTVDLLVSAGRVPARLLMPDLRGWEVALVQTELEGRGFRVGRRRWSGAPGAGSRVAAQTPPGGYPVEAQGTVELLIGR